MRLFFAIPPDPPSIAALTTVQDEMRGQFRHSQVSWVAPENFHITLHFLGEVDEAYVSSLIEETQKRGLPAPFEIRLHEADAFPSKKDPQTLVVHVQIHPSLFGVYKRLGDVIASLGFDIDERPFRPHMTLGRVRARAEVLKPELFHLEVSFVADRVILFESLLTEQGSVYKELSTVILGPP